MSTNKPMNPRIKGLWLEALRSGEYPQGKHELRTTDNTFCCLGVLCELAVKEGVIDEASHNGIFEGESSALLYGPAGDRESTALPKVVQQWAGTDSASPAIELGDEDRRNEGVYTVWLSEENDGGSSFEEIAYLIEKYL